MKLRLPNIVLAKIYRLTRSRHKGVEPLDPEALMAEPFESFLATPTFRYFKVWPWDRERPRWLPVYPTHDYTPSRANFGHPERRAINKNHPVESYGAIPGDIFRVTRAMRGALVYDARFSAHGRQYASDVWCCIELNVEFLRPDTQETRSSGHIAYGWVPAIWLARAD